MNDAQAVAAELDRVWENPSEFITDGCARTIASWFQAGDSEFTRFASNGEIRFCNLRSEIVHEIESATAGFDPDSVRALVFFLVYVNKIGNRPAVNGWSNVWVR